MRYIFSIIIALAIAISVAVFLDSDPGLFVFNYAGYTVQMSFALFVVLMIITVLILYASISLLIGVYKSPKSLRRWRKHRQVIQSEQLITQGLSLMLLGDWKKAEKVFIKGAKVSSHPMLNYLFAARAAQQTGNIQSRDQYLKLAQDLNEGDSDVVNLAQAEMQLDHDQIDQAYATLVHSQSDTDGKLQADKLLLKASLELHEWQEALDLLDQLTSRMALPENIIHAKRIQAYSGLLTDAGCLPTRDEICTIWNDLPKKFQTEITLIDVYITERIRYASTADCEEIIRKVLGKTWDEGLVRLYGLVEGVNALKQLNFAEKLRKNHLKNPVLLLSLGRLYLRNKNLEQARACLEECIEVKANAEAYKELAMLLERQGDQAAAAIYYQEGLNIATGLPGTGDVRLLQNSSESTS
jgi:HemY protein